MNDKTKIIAAASAAAVLIVGAFFAVPALLAAGMSDEPAHPAPSVTSTGTFGSGTTSAAPDRVGQALGDYEPLEVPAGVDFGEGVEVADDALTPSGASAELGQTIVATRADVDFLISVDSIGGIYAGPEMNALIAEQGIDWGYPGLGVTVQEVRMRVRHIGGTGDASTWDIASALSLVGTTGSDMVVMQNAACPGPRTPFHDHDVTTGDTIEVCLLAVGDTNAPAATLASMNVAGVVVEAPALIVEGHED